MKLKQKKAIFHAATVFGVCSVGYIACGLPFERGFAFGVSLTITIIISFVAYYGTMNEGDDDEG